MLCNRSVKLAPDRYEDVPVKLITGQPHAYYLCTFTQPVRPAPMIIYSPS